MQGALDYHSLWPYPCIAALVHHSSAGTLRAGALYGLGLSRYAQGIARNGEEGTMFALSAHRKSLRCIIFAAIALIATPAAAQTVDIRTVALTGDSAPGTASASFQEFSRDGKAPALNNIGNTAFFSLVTGGDTTGSNQIGLWKETPDLILVVRQGDIAPDTLGLKFDFSRFGRAPVLNESNNTAFFANLTTGFSFPPPVPSIWKENLGLTLVALQGDIAPGAGGAIYSGLELPSLNSAGNTAFAAALTGGVIGSGIWKESPLFGPVVLQGDPAPGTVGASFLRFSSFGGTLPLNEFGNTAFHAEVTGGDAIAFVNDRGIWKENPDLTLVARKGDIAPDAGGAVFNFFGTFGGFDSTPSLNDVGNAAIFADLSDHREGIWKESPELRLVALEGDPAPGTQGANFAGFDNFSTGPAINNSGSVAFFGFLTGPGVTDDNNFGIWEVDEFGVHLVVRKGDELEVRPGDFRILNRLDFIQAGFNDSGQIAFTGSFTDGSQGIFVATVTTEVFEVGIDIVPGSLRNIISLQSKA